MGEIYEGIYDRGGDIEPTPPCAFSCQEVRSCFTNSLIDLMLSPNSTILLPSTGITKTKCLYVRPYHVVRFGILLTRFSSDIVMELVTGGDLLNHITSRPDQCLGMYPIEWWSGIRTESLAGEDETKKMAKAICEALAVCFTLSDNCCRLTNSPPYSTRTLLEFRIAISNQRSVIC